VAAWYRRGRTTCCRIFDNCEIHDVQSGVFSQGPSLDYHLYHAVKALLPGGLFPPPIGAGLDEFLRWDDWRALGAFSSGEGGDHAKLLLGRGFYRLVYQSSEFPDSKEDEKIGELEAKLNVYGVVRREAGKSWYKLGAEDLPVAPSTPGKSVELLSACSATVKNLAPSRCVRLYVPKEYRREAELLVKGV
jgi:hypothetical protein